MSQNYAKKLVRIGLIAAIGITSMENIANAQEGTSKECTCLDAHKLECTKGEDAENGEACHNQCKGKLPVYGGSFYGKESGQFTMQVCQAELQKVIRKTKCWCLHRQDNGEWKCTENSATADIEGKNCYALCAVGRRKVAGNVSGTYWGGDDEKFNWKTAEERCKEDKAKTNP